MRTEHKQSSGKVQAERGRAWMRHGRNADRTQTELGQGAGRVQQSVDEARTECGENTNRTRAGPSRARTGPGRAAVRVSADFPVPGRFLSLSCRAAARPRTPSRKRRPSPPPRTGAFTDPATPASSTARKIPLQKKTLAFLTPPSRVYHGGEKTNTNYKGAFAPCWLVSRPPFFL